MGKKGTVSSILGGKGDVSGRINTEIAIKFVGFP